MQTARTVRAACRWKKCLAWPPDVEFGSGMVMDPGLPVVGKIGDAGLEGFVVNELRTAFSVARSKLSQTYSVPR
jgi:hypothetical protein